MSSSGEPPRPDGDMGMPSMSGEGIEPGVLPKPEEKGLRPGDIILDLPPPIDGAEIERSIRDPLDLVEVVLSRGLPGPLLSPRGRGPLNAQGPGTCMLNGILKPGGYSDACMLPPLP